MNHRLIYVCGPSGAGKDSLLAWLRTHIPPSAPVHWARRTISRPLQAGGEAYESVTESEFAQLQAQRAFALVWHANGLHYGIRHRELAPLEHGHWVFLNGSRAHVPEALQHYPGLTLVQITANAQTLRQRLLARGRETPDMVEARVQRALALAQTQPSPAIEIHNDGLLADAGQQWLQALAQLPDWPRTQAMP